MKLRGLVGNFVPNMRMIRRRYLLVVVVMLTVLYCLGRRSPCRTQHFKPTLCISTVGRIGNVMFNYASMFGIARSKGMIPVYHDKSGWIQSVFAHASVIPAEQCSSNMIHRPKQDSAFNEIDVEFSNDEDATLSGTGYYQSWQYFKNNLADIRREFQFTDSIKSAANIAIHNAVSTLKPTHRRTYIMVHVRRGDILEKEINIQRGYTTPSGTYYHKAMDWYRERYPNVVFVVCSDRIDWAKEHLQGDTNEHLQGDTNKQRQGYTNDVVFMEGNTMEVDLAVMSLGNHTVMSVGTFGWWGSFLAGGEAVVYQHPGRPGSFIRQQFSDDLRDFYLPHWHIMDDS